MRAWANFIVAIIVIVVIIVVVYFLVVKGTNNNKKRSLLEEVAVPAARLVARMPSEDEIAQQFGRIAKGRLHLPAVPQ